MKKEPSLFRLIFVLLILSGIAGAVLASVYLATKEPIERLLFERKKEAIAQIFPNYSGDFEIIKMLPEDGKDSLTFYVAFENHKFAGGVVETYSDIGFSGRIEIMVGFDSTGNITGTEVLNHAETPGLGDKIMANKSKFPLQFKGKNPQDFKLKVKKDGGDVDAITAATISSRAFSDAIERAYTGFLNIKLNININNSENE